MAELDVLKLVFGFYITDQIMRADQVIDPEEKAWVLEHYPRRELAALGLIDSEKRLTQRFRDLLGEAMMRIPSELDTDGKLELIDQFLSSALADGAFKVSEEKVIFTAAQLLGLPPELIHHHLVQMGSMDA